MYRAYGGWTFAFEDYLALNITAYIDNMTLMANIVDPYGKKSYSTVQLEYLKVHSSLSKLILLVM